MVPGRRSLSAGSSNQTSGRTENRIESHAESDRTRGGRDENAQRTTEADPSDDEPGPTDPDDRIVSLDVLRGFALLGILVINIQVFAMPYPAAFNPTVYGGASGADYLTWLVFHVFGELKFITLFTVLYGAGVLLFTESKARKGQPVLSLHYRRTIWLFVFGLAHAYLLWYGDILVAYALCAVWVVWARNWSPRSQFLAGGLLLAVPSAIYVTLGLTTQELQPGVLQQWDPPAAAIEAELETYRGGWSDQLEHRVPFAFSAQTTGFLSETMWRVSGLMLWGMVLFRRGILTNDRSRAFYRRLLAIGAIGGLALIVSGILYVEYHDWSGPEAVFLGTQFNYWGSLLLAGAYLAGIMLFCRRWGDRLPGRAFSSVGRTAFSNYILQTVLATSLFYGHGLGLFGHLSRAELVPVVLGIWMIQVALSMLWLRYFRFGPIEWVWRTLTYGSRQPLIRSKKG